MLLWKNRHLNCGMKISSKTKIKRDSKSTLYPKTILFYHEQSTTDLHKLGKRKMNLYNHVGVAALPNKKWRLKVVFVVLLWKNRDPRFGMETSSKMWIKQWFQIHPSSQNNVLLSWAMDDWLAQVGEKKNEFVRESRRRGSLAKQKMQIEGSFCCVVVKEQRSTFWDGDQF